MNADLASESQPKPQASKRALLVVFLVIAFLGLTALLYLFGRSSPNRVVATVEHGRYLATIGACQACHTPPAVPSEPPAPSDLQELARERQFRTDPDWVKYLDRNRQMAGGVPFILRFSGESSGIVYSRNISPDLETGIGAWTEDEIIRAIRTGVRPDGTVLFLFPPHTFYRNLSEEDARALAMYLKSLPPVRNQILERSLPFQPQPATDVSNLKQAPEGRSRERAEYLLSSLVGCTECHSHHAQNGQLQEFVGGDPIDPFTGVFRLGPDLPLRQNEKGFAAFPYPGYAVQYAGNLTRFGQGGDRSNIPIEELVRAIRQGISTQPDEYGRPRPLSHIMLWQFYAEMQDDDVLAIADYIRSLRFVPHDVDPTPILFGTDWQSAFRQVFGEDPSPNDQKIYGKSS